MFVTYRPEGSDAPQTWEWEPRKVRASRAEMIEKRAGENWEAWLMGVQQGNMRARRVLLWHLMSMPHPTMKFEDTPDFYAGELEIQHSAAELVEMRERIVKAGMADDAQAAQILMAIDLELEETRERETARRLDAIDPEWVAPEPEGKAPLRSAASNTRSRSPKSSASVPGSNETS